MKIWLAGNTDLYRERSLGRLWKERLWSYYWWTFTENSYYWLIIKDRETMPEEKKVELFLDSGAYSAKSQGVIINIQDYIKFIKENKDVISVY